MRMFSFGSGPDCSCARNTAWAVAGMGSGRVFGGSGLVRVTKSTTDPLVLCGCNAEIKLDVTNDAATPMRALLTDTLPSCAFFVPGTFAVDGIAMPLANPLATIDLGVLQPGERRTIAYALRICGAGEACCAVVRYVPEGQEWSACAMEESRSNFIQIGLSC